MAHRRLIAALGVGALTVVGGLAATGPDDAGGPPDHAESEQGCQGINEARDRVGDDSPASDVLDQVAELIGDGCEDEDPASDRTPGRP